MTDGAEMMYSSVPWPNTQSNLHEHKILEFPELREVCTRLVVFHGRLNLDGFEWLVCMFSELLTTPRSPSLRNPSLWNFLGMLTDMKTKKDPDDLGGLTGGIQDASAPFILIGDIK